MSSIPPLLPFDAKAACIPTALKSRKRWAPWKGVWDEKRHKYDKIPLKAATPTVGLSTAKPGQWSSFEEALASYNSNASTLSGVGYCMTGPHGVVGVDLDDCVVDGQPAAWAQDIITALGSYAETSPSGRGYRIMGFGSVVNDWTNHDIGIEVYGGHAARFLTITGLHHPSCVTDLRPLDPFVLDDLAQKYGANSKAPDVIELPAPMVLDDLLLQDVGKLALPDGVKRFLLNGELNSKDRSGVLHAAGVSLYALGLDDQTVFSLLVSNRFAMEVALDHRHQDVRRAQMYLWREHCQKAKPKAANAVATPDEFELITTEVGEKSLPLPAFKRDNKGRIEACVNNVTLALQRADFCRIHIRFDKFRDEIMYALEAQRQWLQFTDADYTRLRITLEKRGFKSIGRELIRDVVLLVAMDRCFDSAIEWLRPLVWDGTDRVDTFLNRYMGAVDTPYTRAVSRYIWTALAGRVMQPGVKADMVPILVGEQGVGKSKAVAAISPSPEFFAEVSLHEKDDNLSRLMRGRLVAEMGELRGLHTKELESIKAFITRTHENWVPKYREFATQFARRLIFFGTTNRDEFLADETGNRRWLPFRVEATDSAAIERDRDQLWAQGREIFTLLGVCYQGVEPLSLAAHAEHTIADSWSDAIELWLHQPDALTGSAPVSRPYQRVGEVLKGALRFEDKQIGRREEMRAGGILRKLGYIRKKIRVGKASAWVWCLFPLHERVEGGNS